MLNESCLRMAPISPFVILTLSLQKTSNFLFPSSNRQAKERKKREKNSSFLVVLARICSKSNTHTHTHKTRSSRRLFFVQTFISAFFVCCLARPLTASLNFELLIQELMLLLLLQAVFRTLQLVSSFWADKASWLACVCVRRQATRASFSQNLLSCCLLLAAGRC